MKTVLGFSQVEFAARIDVSLDTIRNWEQGKRCPELIRFEEAIVRRAWSARAVLSSESMRPPNTPPRRAPLLRSPLAVAPHRG